MRILVVALLSVLTLGSCGWETPRQKNTRLKTECVKTELYSYSRGVYRPVLDCTGVNINN